MSTAADKTLHFFGSERYALDDKGRVTVPFDWRREGGGDVFYLVPDSKGECVRAMGEERYVKFGEDAWKQPEMTPEKHRMFMRNFYSQCAKTTTDKQGRITIPKAYCERFNFKGEVKLNGTGDLFEIWNIPAQTAQQKREAAEFAKIAGGMGL